MPKPIKECTDKEIQRRLDFADMLIQSLAKAGKEPILPDRLERERQELLIEQQRRQIGINGEGI